MWLPNVIAFYCIDNRFKESSIIQHRPLGAMVSAQRGTSGLSLSTNLINTAVFMNLLENGPDFFSQCIAITKECPTFAHNRVTRNMQMWVQIFESVKL